MTVSTAFWTGSGKPLNPGAGNGEGSLHTSGVHVASRGKSGPPA